MLQRYIYTDLTSQQQALVDLGMNTILDLIQDCFSNQRVLFTRGDKKELEEKFVDDSIQQETSVRKFEVKNDTQYQLYQWMYNKVLKKQCDAPRRPQTKPNDLQRVLELTTYDLINKFDRLNVNDLCTLKFSLSYVCSTINESMASTFKKAISNDQDWNEVSKAVELPELEEIETVARIFEKVCQPLMKSKPDKDEALLIICQIRAEVLRTTKDTLSLEVLEVLDYVLCNLEAWSELNSDNSSEADYVLAVYPIINILLRNEKSFKSRSGEITSSVTKEVREYIKKVFNIESTTTTYGRVSFDYFDSHTIGPNKFF